MKRKFESDYRGDRGIKRRHIRSETLFFDFRVSGPKTNLSFDGEKISFQDLYKKIQPKRVTDVQIYVELERSLKMNELRNYHISLLKEKVNLPPPKESFNRWLMERRLFSSPRCDPVFPTFKGLPFSPLLFREIEEDIPVKVSVFPEHSISSMKTFCREARKLAENNSLGEQLEKESFEKVLNNVKSYEMKYLGQNLSKVEVLNGLNDLKKIVCPILQKKVRTCIEIVCSELELRSIEYAEHLKKYEERQSLRFEGTRDPIQIEHRGNRVSIYRRNYGSEFVLTRFHYDKLLKLYSEFHSSYKKDFDKNFRTSLFFLLCRYENSFFGNTRKFEGSGHQGAVPSRVMEYLNRRLDVRMECFASPFNCYFRNYCSAFLDCDFDFGSSGDFFRFFPEEGSFEANPPFVEELILKMVDHCENLLEKANENNKCLSFFIVLPNWEDAESIIKLKKCKFLVSSFILEGKKHSYLNGFQHKEMRERYRIYAAVHETRIFVIQSEMGVKKWGALDESFEKEIKTRFHV